MFEQTFKNIDDILYKDSGADSELDYIGQTSWVMFLRYLDELEQDKSDQAALQGKPYKHIIEEQFRWTVWAMPKGKDGKLDHHKAMTGKDLVDFVDLKLFPYLSGFKLKHSDNPQTIEYKIGEIFSELKNKIQSGYNLREILDYADELPFRSTKDKHELSHLYESKIKNMGNAGRNGGQYYTPRPLIRAMIEVVKPKIGDRIYDGACGSGGFLCEAFEYLTRDREKLSTTDLKTLQEKTFYGKEKKNLAYIIGVMNMILHGIEAPNIIHTNTLSENIRDIQEKDRYNVILANPPFGGKERPEVQQNFDIKSSETAFLFLQHFIKNLKAGGSAAIVIKNTFLSNSDSASVSLRKYLLESCNLHTILDMPVGVFTGTTAKTVVLFFEKGSATNKIWYYQLSLKRNLGKSNPLNQNDLEEFLDLQSQKRNSDNSWVVDYNDINKSSFDLAPQNPNSKSEIEIRKAELIIQKIRDLEDLNNSAEIIENYLNDNDNILDYTNWEEKKLKDIVEFYRGLTYSKKDEVSISSNIVLRATNINLDTNKLDLNELKYINDNVIIPDDKKVRKGSIMICTASGSKSHLGKVAFIDQDYDYAFGGFMGLLKPKSDLNPKFVFYLLISNSYKTYIANLSDGMGINNLKFDDLKEFKILIPSLEIQNKIVSIIDDISFEANKIDAILKKKKEDTLELNKSILDKFLNLSII